MDLSAQLDALRASAEEQRSMLDGQKRTEHALVLPLFQALGYDPFDVRHVEPNYEIGLSGQGMEAVDYALKRENRPLLFVQCEDAGTDLDAFEGSFLFRHFEQLPVDVVAFTNGLHYRFYAHLGPNISVDERPFLTFDLMEEAPDQVEQLRALARPVFDAESVLSDAYVRTCSRMLRSYFALQRQSPDDRLVRFLATQVYDAEVTDHVVARFRPVVRGVLKELAGGRADGASRRVGDQGTAPVGDGSPGTTSLGEKAAGASSETRGQGAASLSDVEEADLEAADEVASPPDSDDNAGGVLPDLEDPFDKDLARRVIDFS